MHPSLSASIAFLQVVMIGMHAQYLSLFRLVACVKCRLWCHKSWHRLLLLYQAWDHNEWERSDVSVSFIFSNAARHSGVQPKKIISWCDVIISTRAGFYFFNWGTMKFVGRLWSVGKVDLVRKSRLDLIWVELDFSVEQKLVLIFENVVR